MSNENWQARLFKEKSIFDVVKAYRTFPSNKFNRYILISCLILLVCVSPLLMLGDHVTNALSVKVSIEKIASYIFAYSIAVVGFLIAGLAIFSSFTADKFLLILAKSKYKNTPYSIYQYVFFSFIYVIFFHVFLIGVFFSLFVFMEALNFYSISMLSVNTTVIMYFNYIVFSFLALIFLYSILLVKSFLWNLYSAMVLALVVFANDQGD